jgi:enoyl-[acyl-carrier-protein] reductase (NADH)
MDKDNFKVLKFQQDNNEKIELNSKEKEIKNKLVEIDDKFSSIQRVISSIKNDNRDTIYNIETFDILIESIAMTAATNKISEYFDINTEEIDNLLE